VTPMRSRLKYPKGHIARRRQALFPFAFCALPFAFAFCLLSLLPARSGAQQPYAAIDHDAVKYNGPGREIAHDLPSKEIRVGMLLPLTGERQAEGESLRRAAQMAVDEENASSHPGSPRLLLVIRDESGPWGQASAQVVHMVFDDQAIAIITSTEGGSAHLAEQVGNKVGVPVLTLASDTTTTEINLPWIFRIVPTDTAQAQAFARDIYANRKLEHVLLLTQDDHDGRLGGEEFVKAARALGSAAPAQIVVSSEMRADGVAEKELELAQAVVVWSDAGMANLITQRLRALRLGVPLYLCRKAAESGLADDPSIPCPVCDKPHTNRWTAAPQLNRQARDKFEQRYRQRFGAAPSTSAAEAYDAVRILAASVQKSGPNRARLRDALAEVTAFAGASGVISLDHAGNDITQTTLLPLN
jgi:branched-chain amino acid transport system substrate-binding protein